MSDQISPELEALRRAVTAAGGQSQLARELTRRKAEHDSDTKQGHVWYWLNCSKRCPAEKAIPIEESVSGAVTRHELRPDIYGDPPAAAPPPAKAAAS